MERPRQFSTPPPPGGPSVSDLVAAAVESERLGHGGAGVAAVLRHRLAEGAAGAAGTGWVIEKRLRPGPLRRTSAELLFYTEIAPHLRLEPLHLPRLLLVERRAGEERLLLEAVEGTAPRLGSAMRELGAGIAALETSSSGWLAGLSSSARRRLAPLDFFGPAGRRGFRGHYLLYLGRLLRRRRAKAARLSRIGRRLAALERSLRQAPSCLCHLDPSGKNLIRGADGLTLIDWGQAVLGRPGFDLGAVLAQLARRWGRPGYRDLRGRLLAAHEERLAAAAPALLPVAREGGAFYLGCALLFHLSQPGTIDPRRAAWLFECLEEELGLR